MVESHTADGERPTGLEASTGQRIRVTALGRLATTSGAPRQATVGKQGCRDCEAPQGSPAPKPPGSKVPGSAQWCESATGPLVWRKPITGGRGASKRKRRDSPR